MRPGKTARWRRQTGILLLGLVSLGGASLSTPGRHFLNSARSFVRYYQALGCSGVPAAFWERLVFSLALASADSAGPEQCNGTAMSSS